MIYRIFTDPAAEGASPEVEVSPSGEYIRLEMVSEPRLPNEEGEIVVFKKMPAVVFVQKEASIYLCEDGIRVEF